MAKPFSTHTAHPEPVEGAYWAGLACGLRQAQPERGLEAAHTVHPGYFASHPALFFSIQLWQLPLAKSRTRPI